MMAVTDASAMRREDPSGCAAVGSHGFRRDRPDSSRRASVGLKFGLVPL